MYIKVSESIKVVWVALKTNFLSLVRRFICVYHARRFIFRKVKFWRFFFFILNDIWDLRVHFLDKSRCCLKALQIQTTLSISWIMRALKTKDKELKRRWPRWDVSDPINVHVRLKPRKLSSN